MKKNLISVIILALVFADCVLTALLLFTVLPETKKANAMIDAVCSAINLELNSGQGEEMGNLPIDQIETFDINGGESMIINLRIDTEGDNKSHYAVLGIALLLNKKSDNYVKYSPTVLKEKEAIIKNDINLIVGQYTKTEIDSDPEAVQKDILDDMQKLFGSDYIVGVSFSSKQTE